MRLFCFLYSRHQKGVLWLSFQKALLRLMQLGEVLARFAPSVPYLQRTRCTWQMHAEISAL